MTTPMVTFAQRVRAPPVTAMAVLDTEAPTGMPPNAPAATLPMPCPIMSREAFG